MYQQMLAAGDYNSAAEYDTLHALAKAEYEGEQAREDAALEYAMEEEHKYDWLNCRTCVTRAMGYCNLWRSVSDEGCNTHSNCPVKQKKVGIWMDNMATEKQKTAVERLRKRCGDDMLLRRAKIGKWSDYEFDLDNLTKDEAQRIITTAPSKPIYGIHAPISMVQSL